MKKWLILPLVLVLAGCSAKGLIEKFANPEKVKIARGYIDRLIAGDFDGLAAELDPGLRSGKEIEQLKAMQAMIPKGTPTVTELVGYYVHYNTSGQTRYNVSHQFGYDGKWIVASTVWGEKGSAPREILGLTVTPLAMSLQELNAFSFRRAGLLHYFFLAAAIAVPSFILVMLIQCARTKLPRRKWLWIIFILVGFVQFSLNWSTGGTEVKPLYFQLFGAGAVSDGLYAPWILSISVPVGAIAFWFKRRRLLLQAPPVVGTAT
jgi:hypothetical protein